MPQAHRRPALAALLALSALAASCTPQRHYTRAECQQLFDDCTDACAATCERDEIIRDDPNAGDNTDPYNTGAACAACVEACQERARACDDVPGAPPEAPTDH